MNNLVLVGRLVKDVELKESGDEIKVANIMLAITRPYKNVEGVYETDFIPCKIWNGIAQSTCDYCKKGDLICVRGRLQSKTYEKEDGTKENKIEVIAERVSFLQSKRSED